MNSNIQRYSNDSINKELPTIKGKMIFVEGPDGSGKSTQIKLIEEHLVNKGYKVKLLRNPGMPGEHGDNVRKALFGEDRYQSFWAVRLLFVAEYVEFMERYGYDEECVVLCDRNVIISNTCIGGAEYGSLYDVLEYMSPLYNIPSRKPDTILIYNVEPETAKQRLLSRNASKGDINHYDILPDWFHNKSCYNYSLMENLEEMYPKKLGLSSCHKSIYTIDANDDADDIFKKTLEKLYELYKI